MNNDLILASLKLAEAVKHERDAYKALGFNCPNDAIQDALDEWEKAFKTMKDKMNGK
jgi:hypothetical protein